MITTATSLKYSEKERQIGHVHSSTHMSTNPKIIFGEAQSHKHSEIIGLREDH